MLWFQIPGHETFHYGSDGWTMGDHPAPRSQSSCSGNPPECSSVLTLFWTQIAALKPTHVQPLIIPKGKGRRSIRVALFNRIDPSLHVPAVSLLRYSISIGFCSHPCACFLCTWGYATFLKLIMEHENHQDANVTFFLQVNIQNPNSKLIV